MGIPTSLPALLIFLAFLTPGFIYTRRRDYFRAGVELSPLKELLSVVAISSICNALALFVFTLLRILAPTITPDVGRVVREGANYLRTTYSATAWWGFGLFIGACIIAYLLSGPNASKLRSELALRRPTKWFLAEPEIAHASAWSYVTDIAPDDASVVVGCELSDGSWVQGELLSFNPKPEENGERSVVLVAPLLVRPAGMEKPAELVDYQFTIVSESNIIRMDVAHAADTDLLIEENSKNKATTTPTAQSG